MSDLYLSPAVTSALGYTEAAYHAVEQQQLREKIDTASNEGTKAHLQEILNSHRPFFLIWPSAKVKAPRPVSVEDTTFDFGAQSILDRLHDYTGKVVQRRNIEVRVSKARRADDPRAGEFCAKCTFVRLEECDPYHIWSNEGWVLKDIQVLQTDGRGDKYYRFKPTYSVFTLDPLTILEIETNLGDPLPSTREEFNSSFTKT